MSLVEGAPPTLIMLLLTALALAAVEDGWRLRISNLLVLAVMAGAVTAMVMTAIGWQAWQPIAFAVATLALGTPLFSAGLMGGGDVKLLAASAMWFTLSGIGKMLVAVAVVGGLLTLLVLILRRLPLSDSARARVALLRRGAGIPYGVAIALGMAATIGWVR